MRVVKRKHRYDIVVIGGGVIGFSIAYHLKKMERDVDVVLYESRYPGRGGSTRNAGHFRVHFWSRENTVYAIKSIEMLMRFPGETGWNPTIVRGGYLWLIDDDRVLEAFERYDREVWRGLGVGVEYPSIEDVARRHPYLNLDGFSHAVYAPQDGKLHHDILVYGYMDGFRRRGGDVEIYRPVLGIVVKSGRVLGVDLGDRRVEAEHVVVAAGEYTRDLLDPLGIELPIKAVRKELYVSEPYRPFLDPLVIDTRADADGLYITQTLRGELMGSLDYPHVEGDHSHGTTIRHYRRYAYLAARLMPMIASTTVMRVWSGNYVVTPDNSHIMGRSPEWPEGLYVATGFSGHGLMMAPYTGYLMARHILKGEVHRDMEAFLPTRFEKGRLIGERLVIG